MNNNKYLLLIILTSLFSTLPLIDKAQEIRAVNYDEAIKIASEKHPVFLKNKTVLEQAKFNKRKALALNNTEFNYEYGQINSALTDQAYSVSQTLGSPLLMMSEYKLAKMENREAELQAEMNTVLYKLQIKLFFNHYNWLSAKYDLLKKQMEDCLECFRLTQLKYEVGETSQLPEMYTNLRMNDLNNDIKDLELQLILLEEELPALINADENIKPVKEDFILVLIPETPDSSILFNQLVNASQEINTQKVKTSSLKNTPEVSLGYFNQQIDGTKGFEGIQATVSIPLLFFNKSAETKYERLSANQLNQESEQKKRKYQQELRALQTGLKNKKKWINEYENSILNTVDSIQSQAKKLYTEGEIEYIEYLENMREVMDVKIKYLHLIYEFNQSAIQYKMLTE